MNLRQTGMAVALISCALPAVAGELKAEFMVDRVRIRVINDSPANFDKVKFWKGQTLKETKTNVAPGKDVSWARGGYNDNTTETLSVKVFRNDTPDPIARCDFTVDLDKGDKTTVVTDSCEGIESLRYEKVNDRTELGKDKIRIKISVTR